MAEHPSERRRRIQQQVFATPDDAAFLIDRSKATINRWVAKPDGLTEYLLNGQRFVKLDELRTYATDPRNNTRRRS